jgi:hypothetical protein
LLFSAVGSEKAANAWTHWFGRYLDRVGLAGNGRGLHSLRHNFKDALRARSVPEDLNDAPTGHSNWSAGRSYGAKDEKTRACKNAATVFHNGSSRDLAHFDRRHAVVLNDDILA